RNVDAGGAAGAFDGEIDVAQGGHAHAADVGPVAGGHTDDAEDVARVGVRDGGSGVLGAERSVGVEEDQVEGDALIVLIMEDDAGHDAEAGVGAHCGGQRLRVGEHVAAGVCGGVEGKGNGDD